MKVGSSRTNGQAIDDLPTCLLHRCNVPCPHWQHNIWCSSGSCLFLKVRYKYLSSGKYQRLDNLHVLVPFCNVTDLVRELQMCWPFGPWDTFWNDTVLGSSCRMNTSYIDEKQSNNRFFQSETLVDDSQHLPNNRNNVISTFFLNCCCFYQAHLFFKHRIWNSWSFCVHLHRHENMVYRWSQIGMAWRWKQFAGPLSVRKVTSLV